jgi:hypothetical protein
VNDVMSSLALLRHGNVRSLFADQGITGSDVYAAIVRASGVGDDLVLGVVPRSPATDAVLERAVDAAAERGVLGPSSEHLLLALAVTENLRVSAILDELLTLMVDTALGPPNAPDDTRRAGWRARLEWSARSVRQAYRRHPWGLKVPITAPPLGPNNVAWMEAALEAMADTPLSEPEKLSTLLLISGFVRNEATLNSDIAAARAAVPPSHTYGAIPLRTR